MVGYRSGTTSFSSLERGCRGRVRVGGSSLVGGVHVGALSIVVVSLMVRLLSKRKEKG